MSRSRGTIVTARYSMSPCGSASLVVAMRRALRWNCLARLTMPRESDAAARACVLERYDWNANLQRIARLLETGVVEADT